MLKKSITLALVCVLSLALSKSEHICNGTKDFCKKQYYQICLKKCKKPASTACMTHCDCIAKFIVCVDKCARNQVKLKCETQICNGYCPLATTSESLIPPGAEVTKK